MSSGEQHDQSVEEKEESFLSHLVELRDRLLKSVLVVTAVFLCLFPFSQTIYSWLAGPLLEQLPEGANMIAIEVAAPFLIPFKMVLMLSIFISIPFILYHVWAFIAPALYKKKNSWFYRYWPRVSFCSSRALLLLFLSYSLWSLTF